MFKLQKYNRNRTSPCSSRNLRAFSRNDGVPSTSSRASKIGRPRTKDFGVCLSFAIKQSEEKESAHESIKYNKSKQPVNKRK